MALSSRLLPARKARGNDGNVKAKAKVRKAPCACMRKGCRAPDDESRVVPANAGRRAEWLAAVAPRAGWTEEDDLYHQDAKKLRLNIRHFPATGFWRASLHSKAVRLHQEARPRRQYQMTTAQWRVVSSSPAPVPTICTDAPTRGHAGSSGGRRPRAPTPPRPVARRGQGAHAPTPGSTLLHTGRRAAAVARRTLTADVFTTPSKAGSALAAMRNTPVTPAPVTPHNHKRGKGEKGYVACRCHAGARCNYNLASTPKVTAPKDLAMRQRWCDILMPHGTAAEKAEWTERRRPVYKGHFRPAQLNKQGAVKKGELPRFKPAPHGAAGGSAADTEQRRVIRELELLTRHINRQARSGAVDFQLLDLRGLLDAVQEHNEAAAPAPAPPSVPQSPGAMVDDLIKRMRDDPRVCRYYGRDLFPEPRGHV